MNLPGYFVFADLKLENILFQNSDIMRKITVHTGGKRKDIVVPESFKIKIIDFGGATFDNEHKSTIINTRQYRGPEVSFKLLNMDMYSSAVMSLS